MKIKNQRGQSMVLSVVFLTVLMGMAALVIDAGSWYRAHRAAQSTADASALAGAQGLPDTTRATSLANEYVGKNSGAAPGASGTAITFTKQDFETDTIQVTVTRPHPGFFAKLFGLSTVSVKGRATARAWNVSSVRGVAPITVNYKHSLLNCTRGTKPTCNPTFGVPTTLTPNPGCATNWESEYADQAVDRCHRRAADDERDRARAAAARTATSSSRISPRLVAGRIRTRPPTAGHR